MITEFDFKKYQKIKCKYIVTHLEAKTYYIYDLFNLSYKAKNYILNYEYKKNYKNHLIKKVRVIFMGVVSYQYYDCGVIVCETNSIEYAALRFYENKYIEDKILR